MRTSLSVRIAESPRDKTKLAIPIETLLASASQAGFDGISVRASAVGIDASESEQMAFARSLQTHRLMASMVTGNLALAKNDHTAAAVLRHITPHLDLAERLQCTLVRVMLHTSDDVIDAQRAADEAAERGITLTQQCHWGSLAETADAAVELAQRIDRDNFGITFEPANLLACGGDCGAAAMRKTFPYLKNVYFQNIRLDDASATRFPTRTNGDVGVRFVPLDAPDGLNPHAFFDVLLSERYDGWFTVHQPLLPGQEVSGAIDEAARFVRHLGGI